MKNKNFFKILASFMLIAVIFTGCGGNSDIQLVKEGAMDSHPNVPIGKAFAQFFSNGKWTSFTSTDNEKIVEFNGNCLFLDEPVSMKIQFEILNDSRFSLRHVGIEGEAIDLATRGEFLNKILDDYRP